MNISQQVNKHPVKKINVGTGDQAIRNTLKLMKKIITESAKNYYVRRWAEKITELSPSDIDRIKSIFTFLTERTRYLKDTHGNELLKIPQVSLELLEMGEIPQLDCDDYTILVLSLLKSIGYPVAVKAIAIKPDRKFKHVYGMTKVKNTWVPLDLTKPEYGFGWEYNKPTRIMEIMI